MFADPASSLGTAIQVFCVDLVLSGDNALVIALVCQRIAPSLRGRAILLGTLIAVVLRGVLTAVLGLALLLPLLRLAGAITLLVIAIRLLLDQDAPARDRAALPADDIALRQAITTIVLADLALSLDNVMALAAVAPGQTGMLLLGLAGSIPFLMYGSLFLGRWLSDNPWLLPGCSLLLGWLAGRLAVTDPLLADWVNSQAPAFKWVIPALCAVFVWQESRIIRARLPLIPIPLPTRPNTAVLPVRAPARPAAQPETVALIEHQPVATPASVPPYQPVTDAPAVDPIEASPFWSIGLKLWIALALVIGCICLGWLFYHLFVVGTLPPPSHPHGVESHGA